MIAASEVSPKHLEAIGAYLQEKSAGAPTNLRLLHYRTILLVPLGNNHTRLYLSFMEHQVLLQQVLRRAYTRR